MFLFAFVLVNTMAMNAVDLIIIITHCTKSIQIRSFSGPYFPVFGLNTERYGVSLRIQSEDWKIGTKKNFVFGEHFLRSDC